MPPELVTLKDGRTGYIRKDGTFAPHTEPGQPGNMLAVTHGAYSPRLINEDAEMLLAELVEEHGAVWLHSLDAIVLHNLTRSKARHDRIDARIDSYDDVEDVPRTLWEQVSREARQINDCCSKLGFTATDRATLMKDASWAKALQSREGQQLGQRGRELREARGRA